jgi:hypothetical protein
MIQDLHIMNEEYKHVFKWVSLWSLYINTRVNNYLFDLGSFMFVLVYRTLQFKIKVLN